MMRRPAIGAGCLLLAVSLIGTVGAAGSAG